MLKKYNQIWKKVEKLLKVEFDSEPVYGDNDKSIKTKLKIYNSSMITNFHIKKMPKEKQSCKYSSIIMLDSVIKRKKKYYPQTLLEEWKYKTKKIKMENFSEDDLEKKCLVMSLVLNFIMILMINPMNNLLKAKKVFQ